LGGGEERSLHHYLTAGFLGPFHGLSERGKSGVVADLLFLRVEERERSRGVVKRV
jgi:hypothetical protein